MVVASSIDWPDIVELKDATITPLLGPMSKGSITIGADPPSDIFQHFRYGTEPAVNILPLPALDTAPKVIEEPVIYGGILFRHFGHALAEGIHRLWPRYAHKEVHGASVAFNLVKHFKITPYITEAMNLHGLSRSQMILITEPIRFSRLFVGRQARTLAGPTTIPHYRMMLDSDLSRRLPPPTGSRRLYLSRMNHHHTGSYYGESFVEQALAADGFEIVYPEDFTLTELVTKLRDASLAIFAEGSAIHALELCGSSVPAVAVISRRPVSVERFAPLLSDIADRWMISDHLVATAGMAVDTKKNSGLLNLAALMRDLRSFANLTENFDLRQDEMRRAVNHDIERHIADPRNERTPDYDIRAEDLRKLARDQTSIGAQHAA